MGNLVRGISLGTDREYQGTFLDLLNPFSLFFGLTTVLLFAMHGAIYVSMETGENESKITRETNLYLEVKIRLVGVKHELREALAMTA